MMRGVVDAGDVVIEADIVRRDDNSRQRTPSAAPSPQAGPQESSRTSFQFHDSRHPNVNADVDARKGKYEFPAQVRGLEPRGIAADSARGWYQSPDLRISNTRMNADGMNGKNEIAHAGAPEPHSSPRNRSSLSSSIVANTAHSTVGLKNRAIFRLGDSSKWKTSSLSRFSLSSQDNAVGEQATAGVSEGSQATHDKTSSAMSLRKLVKRVATGMRSSRPGTHSDIVSKSGDDRNETAAPALHYGGTLLCALV